ncbi:MAG TPA: hypothetical protein PLS50_03475, partial [Candidatus Dojkabacteria bacterium]|nr:hypothetical protein [Candidatus Dojkabacteria bacterium]
TMYIHPYTESAQSTTQNAIETMESCNKDLEKIIAKQEDEKVRLKAENEYLEEIFNKRKLDDESRQLAKEALDCISSITLQTKDENEFVDTYSFNSDDDSDLYSDCFEDEAEDENLTALKIDYSKPCIKLTDKCIHEITASCPFCDVITPAKLCADILKQGHKWVIKKKNEEEVLKDAGVIKMYLMTRIAKTLYNLPI